MDQIVILQGLHHKKGKVYTARDVAPKYGIAYVPTPNGKALALALFEGASTHDRPPSVAAKNPPARFHLVVKIYDAK